MVTRPTAVVVAFFLVLATTAEGHLNDDLTEEGQPGWMDRLIEKAKAAQNDYVGEQEERAEDQKVAGALNDDLTEEGQPGWMDRLIEKAKAAQNDYLEKQEKRAEEEEVRLAIPEGLFSQLKAELSQLGAKAKGATQGLKKIREKWSKFSVADRAVLTEALQSSVTNVQTMANFADDPVEGIKAGMSMVSQFAQLAGPTGQGISEALSFISGFFGLLGAEDEKSVGEIVREQIDEALAKFREQRLQDEAAGVAHSFDASKHYVDSLSRSSKTLTVTQAQMLATEVPLYRGLRFQGKLMSIIEEILARNEREEGKKALTFIELYCKLATAKDLIVTETAALFPDELEPNRNALIYTMQKLRDKQKNQLKFLFEGDVKNNIMPWYDPDDYPATDHYLLEVLKVPNYDRGRLNGVYCMAPYFDGDKPRTLDWSRADSRLMPKGKPFVFVGTQRCIWKFVPHANHLYTIRNTYECPDYDWCGSYVVFDSFEDQGMFGTSRVDTRLQLDTKPMLWSVDGSKQRRIRAMYSCETSGKWCEKQITTQRDKGKFISLGLTTDNIGYIWYITKRYPKKGVFN